MPELFVHPVPDNVSDDAAGLIEPLSVGVWACRRGLVGPGSRVLITGAGPIGLVCLQAALAYGATEVVVSDVNAHRLTLATRLGATNVVDVSQVTLSSTGIEPDVLLECSGNARATTDAIRTVARAGRVVLIGMGGDELTLPLSYVQDRELVVTGAFRYANTWPRGHLPWWLRDEWISTRSSPVTTGSTRSRRPSLRRGGTRRRSSR